jgi:2-dehydropantoate 2-reductase
VCRGGFLQGFMARYRHAADLVDLKGTLAEARWCSASSDAWCMPATTDEPGQVCHHFKQAHLGERRENRARAATEHGWKNPASRWRCPTGIQKKTSGSSQHDEPDSALTGATTDLIMNDELVRGFISQVMLEAKGHGARIETSRLTSARRPAPGHPQARRLQDLDAAGRGSRQELDVLVAAGTGPVGPAW